MSKLKITSDKRDVGVYLKFSGEIDEDADFSIVEVSGANGVDIDFQEVTSINSCGVRELYKWVQGIPPQVQINYLNCPEIMVGQFNMVAGLLKPGTKVKSFYTPYFCEKCNAHTDVLFASGKEFTDANVKVPQEVKCSNCQSPTEIDVIEGTYFKFLQRQG
jgi:hypothetical protein